MTIIETENKSILNLFFAKWLLSTDEKVEEEEKEEDYSELNKSLLFVVILSFIHYIFCFANKA